MTIANTDTVLTVYVNFVLSFSDVHILRYKLRRLHMANVLEDEHGEATRGIASPRTPPSLLLHWDQLVTLSSCS